MESNDAAEEISEGDEVSVDLTSGEIRNITTDKTYKAAAFPEFLRK